MRASNTAELVFEDCIVPASNLVGEVGDSMIHMMRNLEIERVALAAMSLGIARRCLFEMNRYAKRGKHLVGKYVISVKCKDTLANHGRNTVLCDLTFTIQQTILF